MAETPIKVERAIAEDADDTLAGVLHRLVMNAMKQEKKSLKDR